MLFFFPEIKVEYSWKFIHHILSIILQSDIGAFRKNMFIAFDNSVTIGRLLIAFITDRSICASSLLASAIQTLLKRVDLTSGGIYNSKTNIWMWAYSGSREKNPQKDLLWRRLQRLYCILKMNKQKRKF